jgi:hypothetical protein
VLGIVRQVVLVELKLSTNYVALDECTLMVLGVEVITVRISHFRLNSINLLSWSYAPIRLSGKGIRNVPCYLARDGLPDCPSSEANCPDSIGPDQV